MDHKFILQIGGVCFGAYILIVYISIIRERWKEINEEIRQEIEDQEKQKK